MDYIVRKAAANDNFNIAKTVTYSFEKIFRIFTRDMGRMAKVFESGVVTSRFYVAEQDGKMIGAVACGDCTQRVFNVRKSDCIKYLGAIRGRLAFRVIRAELLRPHPYAATTGYIDVIGVLPQARGKGVAKKLLSELIANNPKYTEFILDVDSINASAIKSYTSFGFVEYKRVTPMKFINRGKVFMRYKV